jgi:hypothetical protein
VPRHDPSSHSCRGDELRRDVVVNHDANHTTSSRSRGLVSERSHSSAIGLGFRRVVWVHATEVFGVTEIAHPSQRQNLTDRRMPTRSKRRHGVDLLNAFVEVRSLSHSYQASPGHRRASTATQRFDR